MKAMSKATRVRCKWYEYEHSIDETIEIEI